MWNLWTFVSHWGVENIATWETKDWVDVRNQASVLLNKLLLSTSFNNKDLEELQKLIDHNHRFSDTIWWIRIPLDYIWDEGSMTQSLSEIKASHTIRTDWNKKVLILWNELMRKLRVRIREITKKKVRVLMNEWICSDVVRKNIADMREKLSKLWVTKKELDSI